MLYVKSDLEKLVQYMHKFAKSYNGEFSKSSHSLEEEDEEDWPFFEFAKFICLPMGGY